jgi:hypothetical protein
MTAWIGASAIAWIEGPDNLRRYEFVCDHGGEASGGPAPCLVLTVASLGKAFCRGFPAEHGPCGTFRQWRLGRASLVNWALKLNKRTDGDPADGLPLTGLMGNSGVAVAFHCPDCPLDSRLTPVKLARALDGLAAKSDPIGLAKLPLRALFAEGQRLAEQHGRGAPYWDDVEAVYRALDEAAGSAEPGSSRLRSLERAREIEAIISRDRGL